MTVMCYFVCAVLRILHVVNHVLTSEECRKVWLRGDLWSDWLVRTIVLKPPGMIQQTLDLLEEHQGEWWYGSVATHIKGQYACFVHIAAMLHTAHMAVGTLCWFKELFLPSSLHYTATPFSVSELLSKCEIEFFKL